MRNKKLKRIALFVVPLLSLSIVENVILLPKVFADFELTTDTHPTNPDKVKRAKVLWERGNAYADKGLTKKASEYWTLAKELDPSVAETKINGNFGPTSTPAIQDNPDLIDVINFNSDPDRPYNDLVKNLFDKAVSELRLKKYSQALEAIIQAQKVDPDNQQVQTLKKMIETRNSDAVLAEKMEGKAGKESPTVITSTDESVSGETRADLELAEKKEKKNQLIDAKKRHKKISQLSSTMSNQNSEAKADEAYNLGLESYRKGDLASAKKFWSDALELNPQFEQARRNLDRLLNEHPELK